MVFPCIPTHAIYKEWNDGAIAVEIRASDGIFRNVEKTLRETFSIYGPLLYHPKEIISPIKKIHALSLFNLQILGLQIVP